MRATLAAALLCMLAPLPGVRAAEQGAMSCLVHAVRAGSVAACESGRALQVSAPAASGRFSGESLSRFKPQAGPRSAGVRADSLPLYPESRGGKSGSFLTGVKNGFASGFKPLYYGVMSPAAWLMKKDHKAAAWSLFAILVVPAAGLGLLGGLWNALPGGVSEKMDPGSTTLRRL